MTEACVTGERRASWHLYLTCCATSCELSKLSAAIGGLACAGEVEIAREPGGELRRAVPPHTPPSRTAGRAQRAEAELRQANKQRRPA